MSSQQTSDIAYPALKGVAGATAGIAGWTIGDLAALAALVLNVLLIGDWLWKKWLRPLAERKGWKARPEYRRRSSDLAALALAAAILCAVPQPVYAEELRRTFDNNVTVVLDDSTPCTAPNALAIIKPEFRDTFFGGIAHYEDRRVGLCWKRFDEHGIIGIVDDEGHVGQYDSDSFKPVGISI